MKIHEIREISIEELRKRIVEEQDGIANLKFQKSVSQLESPIKIRLARRIIARLKTVLREKEMQASKDTSRLQTEKTVTQ